MQAPGKREAPEGDSSVTEKERRLHFLPWAPCNRVSSTASLRAGSVSSLDSPTRLRAPQSDSAPSPCLLTKSCLGTNPQEQPHWAARASQEAPRVLSRGLASSHLARLPKPPWVGSSLRSTSLQLCKWPSRGLRASHTAPQRPLVTGPRCVTLHTQRSQRHGHDEQ